MKKGDRRYYIRFGYKGAAYRDKNGRWRFPYAVWPKLFLTEEAAWKHLNSCVRGGFVNSEKTDDRPEIRSISVHLTRLKNLP